MTTTLPKTHTSTTAPEQLIRDILKAQGTVDLIDDLHAHQAAVDQGQALVPGLRKALLRGTRKNALKPGQMSRFTALSLALRDIDEAASRELYQQLRARRDVNAAYLARLRTITSFTLEDFARFEVRGISLYVARSLGDVATKAELIQAWIATLPEEDLAGIRRFFVIDKQDSHYWGLYLRVLATITLVWRGPDAVNWWSAPMMRFTLYHEVGHHVLRRREQLVGEENLDHEEDLSDREDPGDQEDLADDYALAQMRKVRPLVTFGIFGTILAVLSRTGLGRRVAQSVED